MIEKDNKNELKEKNTLALLGFIFSLTFCLAIPGFVLSILGLVDCKKCKNDRKGLAIAGIVVSSFIIIVSLLSIIFGDTSYENDKYNYPIENSKTNKSQVCVTFMLDDSQYLKKCGESGFKVEKPANPSKEGYEFKFWSTKKDSKDKTNEYNFDLYVNLDKTLYSVFEKKTENPVVPVPSISRYETIYNEYSSRLRSECPSLSITECATIANEGVTKMAEYMYSASGTEGQYATYESWATKLYDVYLESAR